MPFEENAVVQSECGPPIKGIKVYPKAKSHQLRFISIEMFCIHIFFIFLQDKTDAL